MYDIILVFGGHLMNKLEKTLIAEIKATLKDKFEYDAPEDMVMVEITKRFRQWRLFYQHCHAFDKDIKKEDLKILPKK